MKRSPRASRRTRNNVAGLTTALLLSGSAQSQPAPQPDVVCDLTPILVGTVEDGKLRTRELAKENAEPIRLTFRDIDPANAVAKMIVGEGASGELDVAVAVESGALAFLSERPGLSKAMITVQTTPGTTGWPAIMSEHSWQRGVVSVRALSGACLLRAR